MCRFVVLRKAFSSSASFLRCSMSSWRPDLRCVKASTFLVSISPSRFKAPNSAFLRLRLATVFADLAIECPIGRIDDPRRLRNRRGPIVHKAIQTVALPHISEEVFLRPSGEHGRSQTDRRSLVIGA